MSKGYLVIGILALGTYLLRLLPILFLKNKGVSFLSGEILDYVATALISALLVTTFLGLSAAAGKLFVGLLTLGVVYLSYSRWKSIGISVVIGIAAHFLFSNLLAF